MAYDGSDIFQTQSDQRFNSFTSPMNGVNMNPGNWGINPAYLTPSYLSPYRPQYQGPQGSQGPGPRPGFWGSFNHTFNPFEGGGQNYGGRTQDQQMPYYDALFRKPDDLGFAFAQKFALPTVASYYATKHFFGPGGNLGRGIGSGFVKQTLGGVLSPDKLATGMKWGGGIGSLIGETALPVALATAAVKTADSLIFDPYIQQRKMAENLESNFNGVTFSDGLGSKLTGRGFSRRGSAGVAAGLAQIGAKDLTFNQQEIGQLTDYSARAGLLDNVQGNQIPQRMKKIVQEVKAVMAIANTSDFKEAIETISKLQQSGAYGSQLSSALGTIGAISSAAGISAQKFMNTTGAQGQYLFQSNSMTPFIGALTAGQAQASFASAYRTGLMSPAQMARMGGVEGATQSANAGLVAGLSSTYARVSAMNSYFGAGDSGSIAGNMNQYGGKLASGGVAEMGRFNMLSPGLTGKLAQDRGVMAIHDQIMQFADTNRAQYYNKDGKVDAGAAYQYLTSVQGQTHDQAMAMLAQLHAGQDPRSFKQSMAGFGSAEADFDLKQREQQGLSYGWFTPAIQRAKAAGRWMKGKGTGASSGPIGVTSHLIDEFSTWWTQAMGRFDDNYKAGSISEMMTKKGSTQQQLALNSLEGLDKTKDYIMRDYYTTGNSVMKEINRLASSGDETARKVISSSGQERSAALQKLAREGKIEKGDIKAVEEMINKNGTITVSASSENLEALKNRQEKISGDLFSKKASGGIFGLFQDTPDKDTSHSLLESDEYVGLLESLDDHVSGNKTLSKGELERVSSRLEQIKAGSSDITNLDDNLKTAYSSLSEAGYKTLGGVSKKLGLSSSDIQDIKAGRNLDSIAKKYGISADQAKSGKELEAALLSKGGADAMQNGAKEGSYQYLSAEEFRQSKQVIQGIEEQKSKIIELNKKGKIDFTQTQEMMRVLDEKETTQKFDDAVRAFSNAVAEVTGKGNTNSPPPMSKLREQPNSIRSQAQEYVNKKYGY